MTRPQFTHDLARGNWQSDNSTILRIDRADGETEKWGYYLRRGSDGKMSPALPPAAKKEDNQIAEETNS